MDFGQVEYHSSNFKNYSIIMKWKSNKFVFSFFVNLNVLYSMRKFLPHFLADIQPGGLLIFIPGKSCSWSYHEHEELLHPNSFQIIKFWFDPALRYESNGVFFSSLIFIDNTFSNFSSMRTLVTPFLVHFELFD